MSAGKVSIEKQGHLLLIGLDENKRLREPIVMAVQGICPTTGIELLLATDIRVAARNTRFAQTIAAQASLGIAATLKSAHIARHQRECAAIKRLLPDMLPLMNSEDAQESIQSFLERRTAKFKGK